MGKKTRVTPRISLNKLGEYLVASPIRRQRILQDQKHPQDFIVTRYRETIEPIIKYILSGMNDDTIILDAIDQITQAEKKSSFCEQDHALSIEALEAFLDLTDHINFSNFTCHQCEDRPEKLSIAGVEISVNPNIVLEGQIKGKKSIGLLKLYLAKNHPLDEPSGQYIGALLQKYAESFFSKEQIVDHKICIVIDVFAQKVYHAPKAYRRRLENISAACLEIAQMWNVI